MKKIIESNPKIETVFIQFSNNQIISEMDKWIFEDSYLLERYPQFSSVINFSAFSLLARNNFKSLLIAQSFALNKNITFLFHNRDSYLQFQEWGGFSSIKISDTDSLIEKLPNQYKIHYSRSNLSKTNLLYLSKMIDWLNAKHIKVYLVRSPLHSNYNLLSNEFQFKNIIHTKFKNTEFLDFRKFPLKNEELWNLHHLNYKGAKKFSVFFNRLLKTGLLENSNKQKMIDSLIEQNLN